MRQALHLSKGWAILVSGIGEAGELAVFCHRLPFFTMCKPLIDGRLR